MEELLLEWWDNFPRLNDEAPSMSLRNQAKYLSKKYKTIEHEFEEKLYNNNGEVEEVIQDIRTLICFKDIICKYRPHLHMGDYWLDIKIIDEQINYKFWAFIEPNEGDQKIVTAHHPHLSGGIPCLGSFQGDLATNFKNGDFIQFFSVMKAYLQAYNGRSTYTRGTVYKKRKLTGHMHNYSQIQEMFQAEESDPIDVYSVARDPMRWNWPKDMTAYDGFEVEGQSKPHIAQYIEDVKFPILKHHRHSIFQPNDNVLKVLGYVVAAHKIGELPLFQAFEFVKIMLFSLQAQYEGDMDAELLTKLKKMASQVYDVKQNGSFRINDRYQTRASGDSIEAARLLWQTLKEYYVNPYGSNRSGDKFAESLKYLGFSLSNFVILLRKRSPHLARAKTYLLKVKGRIDVDSINSQYNTIKKEAYTMALATIDKERKRFINELNKPEISNIIGTDGQGTLFTENL